MNIEKFTDRAKGFLQSAQTVAIRNNHQRVAPEHVLKALLEDEEGMASNLIRAAGGNAATDVPPPGATATVMSGSDATFIASARTSHHDRRMPGTRRLPAREGTMEKRRLERPAWRFSFGILPNRSVVAKSCW